MKLAFLSVLFSLVVSAPALADQTLQTNPFSRFVGMYSVQKSQCIVNGYVYNDPSNGCTISCVQIGFSETDGMYFIKTIALPQPPIENDLWMKKDIAKPTNGAVFSAEVNAPDSQSAKYASETTLNGQVGQTRSWLITETTSGFTLVYTGFDEAAFPMPTIRAAVTYQLQAGPCIYNP